MLHVSHLAGWSMDYRFLFEISGSLTRLSKEESFDITLKVLQCEVFTVSPIMVGATHHSFFL